MKTKICWIAAILMTFHSISFAQVHPMNPKNETSVWNRLNGKLLNEGSLKLNQNTSKLNGTETSYWNGTAMELTAKTEYVYDNEQLKTVQYYLFDNSEWNEDSKRLLTYQNGRLSSNTFLIYDFNTESYLPVDQLNYGYINIDNEFRLFSEIYREWEEESGWVTIGKFEYQYDQGLISGGSEYTWNSLEWVEVERFTTIFQDDTTYLNYYELNTEIWEEVSREIYPGMTIAELYSIYTEISETIDLVSFLNLEFPDYIYQEKIDGVWENVEAQLTSDYFDIWDGKLKMRDIQHQLWDGSWSVIYNSEIWYNQKTLPDSATMNVFYDEGKEPVGQEIYRYNDDSQLAEVDYLQNVGNGLSLQSNTKLLWLTETANEEPLDPVHFKLKHAYPNPFNPTTTISFSMEKAGLVRVNVYDMLGRYITTLVNGVRPSGDHQVVFDASELASGIYIIRMEAEGYQKNQLITLVK